MQGTSRARWTQWKGSASHGRGGSCCPPCPLAAAPAPAAQPLTCSSSSVEWPRAPVELLRLSACVMHPDNGSSAWGAAPAEHQVPEDGDRVCRAPRSCRPVIPSTAAAYCSSHGFLQRTRNPSRLPQQRSPGAKPGAQGRTRLLAWGAMEVGLSLAMLPHPAPCPCRVCSSECCVVVDPVDVSCSAEVPCSSVPRR